MYKFSPRLRFLEKNFPHSEEFNSLRGVENKNNNSFHNTVLQDFFILGQGGTENEIVSPYQLKEPTNRFDLKIHLFYDLICCVYALRIDI